MSYKGKYKIQNPSKYSGSQPNNIVWRSLWERKFMIFCDLNPKIIKWESEEVIIPYVSKLDGKVHRYFMDFKIQYKNREGKIETTLVEIKPFIKTTSPIRSSKVTQRYLREVEEYAKNISKWEATKEYCKQKGWNFRIFTEYELGLKKRK